MAGGNKGQEAVLGVNVAAGVAYLALVSRPNVPNFHVVNKLELATNVDEWDQLKQFGQRLLDEARARNCVAVVFAKPRMFAGWAYSDAFSRASLQVAAGLALREADVDIREVAQVTAAKTLGLKLGVLDAKLAETIGVDPSTVKHWKQRIPAFAVALHVAKELWP